MWKHAERDETWAAKTGLITTLEVFGSTRCETPFASVH
jgi:hypothetical protein